MSSLPQHLDLHLIRILYLLLVEKNVSRVALKLNQPQPSISASLRKLRELTGDPLLVRGARGMVPTQHGESLLKPAKRILDETESLFIKKSPFVPEEAERTFHIAAPDYLDTQFLPNVVASIRRGAPNSKVAIHHLGAGTDYLRMLSDGDIDLVIANWDEPPAHLHISKLFEDPIICTMRADSAYAKRTAGDAMTLEDYLSLPHVAPSPMLPGYHGVIDAFLERAGPAPQRGGRVALLRPDPLHADPDRPGADHRPPVHPLLRTHAAAEEFHGAGQVPADALLPAVAPAGAPVDRA